MLLIVDDDPGFIQQVESSLCAGRDALFARDAEHAKELLRSVGAAFTAVMIDLDLPGQDGFSLIQELRDHFPDLPVIAISGMAQEHILDIARYCGAEYALAKPIGPEWNEALRALGARAA